MLRVITADYIELRRLYLNYYLYIIGIKNYSIQIQTIHQCEEHLRLFNCLHFFII